MRRILNASSASRLDVVTIALAVTSAGALSFVPGFNALNYFSALVLSVVLSLLVGWRCAVATARNPQPARITTSFARSAAFSLVAACAALVPLLVAGLVVKNCDLLEGFGFYGVGPVMSGLFASQVGTCIGAFRRKTRPWIAGLWFIGVFVAWAAYDLWHVYRHPPIFAYNPFCGFFSGAIYDDLIELDTRLFLYRLNNLLQLSVLWTLTSLRWPTREPVARWRRWLQLTGLLLGVVGASSFFGARGVVGYEISRDDIITQLGGNVSNERLTLVYDASHLSVEMAERLLEDHSFRLWQLESQLGVRFPKRITSFVYRDNLQKRRLMGAHRVFIAKPWQSEIHLGPVGYGAPVVHHELAHVVLGTFAAGPLAVPSKCGVLPHMALVEGAAEAMEWYGGQLTSHQWAAAMRREGIAPDLNVIMGPSGFWQQSAAKAYTLAGSFVRWLLDTEGPEKLKIAYRNANFLEAYGRSLPTLVGEWEAFIDKTVTLSPEASRLSRELFSGRGVLRRVCPLEVPRVESEAQRHLSRGDIDRAIALLEQVANWVPESSRKRLQVMKLWARKGNVEETRRGLERLRSLPNATQTAIAWGQEFLGDAQWRQSRPEQAAEHYRIASRAPLSESRRRHVLFKQRVAGSSTMEAIIGPYLLGPIGEHSEAITYLSEGLVDLEGAPLVAYLLGRRLYLADRFEESAHMLFRAQSGLRHSDDTLHGLVRRESLRLMGKAYYFAGQLDNAERSFEEAERLAVDESDRLTWADWQKRVRYKRGGR